MCAFPRDKMKSTVDGDWCLVPMGDCCLIIEFGVKVDMATNQMVHAVADYLQAHPPKGVIDIVPSFTAVALHYRPEALEHVSASPYKQLKDVVEAILGSGITAKQRTARIVEIPVCYGGELGPDLVEVAAACRLTPDQVVALHGASESVVFMLGFAPGFPYAGGLDPKIAVPRRATPRTSVSEGTVAIANRQTVIYSMQSPGGWNLIGRTPLKLFDPASTPPCLLQPGDQLRFVAISRQQFDAIRERKS